MTPDQTETVGQIIVLTITVLALVIGLVSMLIGKLTGNDVPAPAAQPPAAPAVHMSSTPSSGALESRLSLQTDGQTAQTDSADGGAGDINEERRAALLDLYRLLRASKIGRETARPILKAAGIPLDNNLWRDAQEVPTPEAAPDPPVALTPIAGRKFDPSLYHEDAPDLRFVPPS